MFYVMICPYIANGAAREDHPKIIRDRLTNQDLRNLLLHVRIFRFLQLSGQKKQCNLPASVFLVPSGTSLERESLDTNLNPNQKAE